MKLKFFEIILFLLCSFYCGRIFANPCPEVILKVFGGLAPDVKGSAVEVAERLLASMGGDPHSGVNALVLLQALGVPQERRNQLANEAIQAELTTLTSYISIVLPKGGEELAAIRKLIDTPPSIPAAGRGELATLGVNFQTKWELAKVGSSVPGIFAAINFQLLHYPPAVAIGQAAQHGYENARFQGDREKAQRFLEIALHSGNFLDLAESSLFDDDVLRINLARYMLQVYFSNPRLNPLWLAGALSALSGVSSPQWRPLAKEMLYDFCWQMTRPEMLTDGLNPESKSMWPIGLSYYALNRIGEPNGYSVDSDGNRQRKFRLSDAKALQLARETVPLLLLPERASTYLLSVVLGLVQATGDPALAKQFADFTLHEMRHPDPQELVLLKILAARFYYLANEKVAARKILIDIVKEQISFAGFRPGFIRAWAGFMCEAGDSEGLMALGHFMSATLVRYRTRMTVSEISTWKFFEAKVLALKDAPSLANFFEQFQPVYSVPAEQAAWYRESQRVAAHLKAMQTSPFIEEHREEILAEANQSLLFGDGETAGQMFQALHSRKGLVAVGDFFADSDDPKNLRVALLFYSLASRMPKSQYETPFSDN